MTRESAVRPRSLSSRLLVLTAFFVMLGEVLIFAPSVARFRMSWFEDRIAAGRIAVLALEASPSGEIGAQLTRRLLDHVGAEGVVLSRPGGIVLMLNQPVPPPIDLTIDLHHPSMIEAIRREASSGSARKLVMLAVTRRIGRTKSHCSER